MEGSTMRDGPDPRPRSTGRPSLTRLEAGALDPVPVEVEVARAGRTATSRQLVAAGTLVREIVRAAGEAPEGSAVLHEDVSIPLDTPVTAPMRLVVVPTFSGG